MDLAASGCATPFCEGRTMWRCLWTAVLHAALVVAEEGGADGPGVHRERLDHPAAVSAAGKTRFLPPRSGV